MIKESGEMYLETILILSKKLPQVRSIDICDHMGYSKPSVSRAVNKLKSDGYISIDCDGHLKLTDKGYNIASKIYERHVMLSEFLSHLGVDAKTATEDACKMEHIISDESFNAMKEFLKNKNNKIKIK